LRNDQDSISFVEDDSVARETPRSTMTTQDHNKKTLRQFQCRDYLWEIFEQMGAELECSTDYLVNEAMRQYARSRSWGNRQQGNRGSQPGHAPIAPSGSSPGVPRTTSPALTASSVSTTTGGAQRGGTPQVRTGSNTAPVAAGRAPQTGTGPGSLPPPLPSAGSTGVGRHPGGLPSLYVIFNGQKVPVNKEEFVIGRGSKTADLPIKDGNISRRHAAIVFQNGGFFMKDLGSTNGIEFAGERVDVKRIEEGDVFQLCDYELRFTYR
jgi:hypothetical protein